MQILVTNTWSTLSNAQASLVSALDKKFSWFQDGYFFSKLYKRRIWDGRVHLVEVKEDERGRSIARFPTGLLREVLAFFEHRGAEVSLVESRSTPEACPALANWQFEGSLRWYQQEAFQVAQRSQGGVFKLAPRAGKTLLASKIVSHFGLKTLFVVPSLLLLDQAFEVLSARLPSASVTRLGSGKRDLTGDIVIATMGSILKRVDEVNAYNWGLLIVDEVHHCASDGKKWRESILAINARYKFGLTGTLEMPDEKSKVKNGTAWVRGIFGPILYERSSSDLVEDGALMESTVSFLRHDSPELLEGDVWEVAERQHQERVRIRMEAWEKESARRKAEGKRPKVQPKDEIGKAAFQTALYDLAITHCDKRNSRIIEKARHHVELGHRVLIDVQRVEHVEVLYDLALQVFDRSRVAAITGSTIQADVAKADVLAALNSGQIPLVIGNVLGEGVDIPNLNVVINAEAGKGYNSIFQRMRHLNKVEGKEVAILYDFVDEHHEQFKKWTLLRIENYKKERALTLKVERKTRRAA